MKKIIIIISLILIFTASVFVIKKTEAGLLQTIAGLVCVAFPAALIFMGLQKLMKPKNPEGK